MSQDLTYGLKKPLDGDRGQPLFDELAENFEHIDAHSHNGTDSAQLSIAAINKVTQSIAAGSWAADGTTYKQDVSITGGLQFDNISIEIRDASDNSVMYLDIVKSAAAVYTIDCNDSSKTLTAVYT